MSGRHLRAAVDIGGTFTDIQVLDTESGQTWAYKTATTPRDPGAGLVTGLTEAAAFHGFDPGDISTLMHGTTIATNAVLEDRLGRGALLTTAGFEDVLEIGRHVRSEIYTARAEPRRLLVPRERRLGVTERIRADGRIETPLTDDELVRVCDAVEALEVDTVAVCLLHAYANTSHEQQLVAAIQARLPGVNVCASHAVSPELREFERTSTTVLNALLMPRVSRYLENLEAALVRTGISASLYLFQSNGGVLSARDAAATPVRLLLSGPAGGALAVQTLGEFADTADLVGIDMGGTSFDVCVIEGGRTREVMQGEVAGCPVRSPMTEIRTISAGGGSIAAVDDAGRLTVGPLSAGAMPGPAAYGHGGERATVTDANVVLKRLDPGQFLNAAMTLDAGAAERVVADCVGERLAVLPAPAADGILKIAVAQMANAIRLSLYEKGLDPRDFTLMSFGGAGGLHAADVAEQLGATRVLYPIDAATLSAWGMLFADITLDFAATRVLPATEQNLEALNEKLKPLVDAATAALDREALPGDARRLEMWADMRYRGQAYEIATLVGELSADAATRGTCFVTAPMLAAAAGRFHAQHLAQFAHADHDAAPEIVTIRLRAIGVLPKPDHLGADSALAAAPTDDTRAVFIDGETRDIPVLTRTALGQAGADGPLIVEDSRTTLYVPAGWRIAHAPAHCLLATRRDES